MSFSPEWEAMYAGKEFNPGAAGYLFQLLSGFNFPKPEKVLELGCGWGANIDYWLHRGATYFGVDGSESAIKSIRERHKDNPRVFVGEADFTKHLYGEDFDIIFDRAAVSHNDLEGIWDTVDRIHGALHQEGIFIGCDWFSTNHSELARGTVCGDERTKTDYPDGQFTGVGKVHFSDREELEELFGRFDCMLLNERILRRCASGGFIKKVLPYRWIGRDFDQGEYVSAVWDFVMRKP